MACMARCTTAMHVFCACLYMKHCDKPTERPVSCLGRTGTHASERLCLVCSGIQWHFVPWWGGRPLHAPPPPQKALHARRRAHVAKQ